MNASMGFRAGGCVFGASRVTGVLNAQWVFAPAASAVTHGVKTSATGNPARRGSAIRNMGSLLCSRTWECTMAGTSGIVSHFARLFHAGNHHANTSCTHSIRYLGRLTPPVHQSRRETERPVYCD